SVKTSRGSHTQFFSVPRSSFPFNVRQNTFLGFFKISPSDASEKRGEPELTKSASTATLLRVKFKSREISTSARGEGGAVAASRSSRAVLASRKTSIGSLITLAIMVDVLGHARSRQQAARRFPGRCPHWKGQHGPRLSGMASFPPAPRRPQGPQGGDLHARR